MFSQSLEDAILAYLQQQEGIPEDFDFLEQMYEIEQDIKYVLEDLLLKVNKRIACKDRYENVKQWHNQYPLFDLTDYLPGFCVDDDLFEKLAFRETLLISELNVTSESKECKPKSVGGICINIQTAEGHLPEKRENPIDAELDREIFQILQRVRREALRKVSIAPDSLEQRLQEKLEEYEVFLRNEMKQNVRKFVIHVSSQFDVCGFNGGSRITTWADRHFHTLEEKRTEFVEEPHSVLNQKSLYVALQNHKYYVKHVSVFDNFEQRKYYGLNKTKEYISEGASFILMRYLAITKFQGTFELTTMYINGDMCRNIYECTGPTTGEVNGKTVGICKIYRYIVEQCGIEHHCVTVLTVYGRIITQEWEGCNYIMNMNPLHYISEPPSPCDRLVLEKTWADDMQLMSKYLDCKTDAEKNMKKYLEDRPEVKEMIQDYVQNILMLKPDNILNFTMDYFQSLYPFKLARLPFMEESVVFGKGDSEMDLFE